MQYRIQDLLHLMGRLRASEGGCPWDLAQTAQTIINYSIEEVYELADAIERGDASAEQDELGDVLFQVIFLARLAEEQQNYNFADVVQGLCEKLLRRHPHVFPNADLYCNLISAAEHDSLPPVDARAVAANWEIIKQGERKARQFDGLFADVPRTLPALQSAKKLQKRAALIGLDWPGPGGAFSALASELEELQAAMLASGIGVDVGSAGASAETMPAQMPTQTAATNTPAPQQAFPGELPSEVPSQVPSELADELGDVLFSCVNVARKLGLDAEQCLRRANNRFVQRVEFVADQLPAAQQHANAHAASADELDALWQLAKKSIG